MMRGNQEVFADEEVDVLGLQVIGIRGLLVEAHGAKYHEQVAVIGLDLGASVRVHHVFDRQRVETENLLKQRQLWTN